MYSSLLRAWDGAIGRELIDRLAASCTLRQAACLLTSSLGVLLSRLR